MNDSNKTMSINNSTNRNSANTAATASSMKYRQAGEFIQRPSLFTELFQISHVRCVRNSLTAAFILMMSRQVINDFIHHGRLNWTFELLCLAFGKLHIAAMTWSLMILSTSFVVFYSTYMWACNRNSSRYFHKIYDIFWLLLYICYLILLLLVPSWQIIQYRLPFASAAIVLGEQLRLLMKTHSFVRENVRKVLQRSNKSSDEQLSVEFSHFNQYIYFLFAPTLIYRDSYPRTSSIRWRIVFNMFGQFSIIFVLFYHVIVYYWMPLFEPFFTKDEITFEFSMSTIYDLMIPAVLNVILAFYSFFHCWLNGFAELLRFADRMFYEDWWNFTSAATFWRTWNLVVHDWLYIYVYQDTKKILNNNRTLSTSCVVMLSAFFHEYFMIITLGIFSPVLIIWFVIFGMLFRFAFPNATGTRWNIILLTLLPICVAVIPYFYVLEVSGRYFPSTRKTCWSAMFRNDKQSNDDL